MFRTIETPIWSDPKIRKLNTDGKLLFIYLITNSHAHVGGIYYIPEVLIFLETGIKKKKLDTLWDTLSNLKLIYRDRVFDVVWVVNMLRYQGKGEKIQISVQKHLRTLHDTELIPRFIKHYKDWEFVLPDRVSDRVSEVGVKEQEQIKDKDIEIGGLFLKGEEDVKMGGRRPSKNQKGIKGNVDKSVDKCEAVWLKRLKRIQSRTWGSVLLNEKQLTVLLDGEGKVPGYGDPRLLWLAIALTKRIPRIPTGYLQVKAKDQDTIHRLRKQADNMHDGDFDNVQWRL